MVEGGVAHCGKEAMRGGRGASRVNGSLVVVDSFVGLSFRGPFVRNS